LFTLLPTQHFFPHRRRCEEKEKVAEKREANSYRKITSTNPNDPSTYIFSHSPQLSWSQQYILHFALDIDLFDSVVEVTVATAVAIMVRYGLVRNRYLKERG
jgi:hypothetical protein